MLLLFTALNTVLFSYISPDKSSFVLNPLEIALLGETFQTFENYMQFRTSDFVPMYLRFLLYICCKGQEIFSRQKLRIVVYFSS